MSSFVSQQGSSKSSNWGERWVASHQPPLSMQNNNGNSTGRQHPANQEYSGQQYQSNPQAQNGNQPGRPSGQNQQYRSNPQAQNGNQPGRPSGQNQQYQSNPQAQNGNQPGRPSGQIQQSQSNPQAQNGNQPGRPSGQGRQYRPDPQAQNGNQPGYPSGQNQQYRSNPQDQNGNQPGYPSGQIPQSQSNPQAQNGNQLGHPSGQGRQYRPEPQARNQSAQQLVSDEVDMDGLYPRFFGIKAHGTKAAIYFTPDKTKNGYQTVAIEAAEMLIPAEKKYNWNQKTRLQLTRTEILDVIAVMLGLSPGCEFGNHKGANNAVKSFTMKHQGKSVFVSVSESGRPIKAVPIPVMEAVQIGHMILTVYIQNYPGLSPDVVIPTLARAINGRTAPQQA